MANSVSLATHEELEGFICSGCCVAAGVLRMGQGSEFTINSPAWTNLAGTMNQSVDSVISFTGSVDRITLDGSSCGDGTIIARGTPLVATVGNRGQGIIARATDAIHAYLFSLNATHLSIGKYDGGFSTLASTSHVYAAGDRPILRVVLSGISLTVYDDTNSISATATDPTHFTGLFGVAAFYAGNAMDYVFFTTGTSYTATSPAQDMTTATSFNHLSWEEEVTGDGAVTATVQGSADNVTYADVATGLTDPSGSDFTEASYRYWKIIFLGTATSGNDARVGGISLSYATASMTEGTGLDVSKATLGSNVELSNDDVELVQRNLGKDCLSASKSILAWADYSSDTDFNYAVGWSKSHITGSVTVAGGEVDCANTGMIRYSSGKNYPISSTTIVIRCTPNWNGNDPGANEILFSSYQGGTTALNNRVVILISNGTGILRAIINDADAVEIAKLEATASEVNGGATWSTSEECYVALTIDATNNVARLYAGRVSGGTATEWESGTVTGIETETDGATAIIFGGRLTNEYSNLKYSEFILFDGPISAAASFTIPTEIARIFSESSTSAEVATFEKVYLGTGGSTDTSDINVTLSGDVTFQYSANDSATPVWSGSWVSLATIQALGTLSSEYWHMKALVKSADGVTGSVAYETGNYHPSGSGGAPPNTPAFDAIATSDGKFTVTVTPSSVNYDKTVILYRVWSPATAGTWSSQDYSGVAGTQGTVDVSGLSNYTFYEVQLYDASSDSVLSAPTVTRMVYVTDETSPLTDRMIAVRNRISGAISEFTLVKIVPELGMVGQQKQPYCIVTSGGGARRYENSGWGPQTIRVAVFVELQRDIFTEETVIGNATTGDKGLNDFCDEIVALFDDYVPDDNSPAFHFQATRVSATQKIEAANPESWLRMQVVDITVQFEET